MKTFFIILLLISSTIVAQVEYSRGVVAVGDFPGFYIDAANYKSDQPGKTRIDVFLQIPYQNLQFVKHKGKFQAKYSVTLSFYDEDKDDLLLEKVWNAKITVPSFEIASSENNFKYDYRSFDLDPETYTMECNLYDKDSKKEYTVDAVIELKEFDKEIQFSDLIFIDAEIDSQIIPNISNTVESTDSSLSFFYEIYSDKDQILNLKYEIENSEEDIIYNASVAQKILQGTNFIKHKLEGTSVSLGKYRLIAKAVDSDDDIIVGTSKYFVSRIYGFPATITDLDEAVEQMVYIAGSTVLDDIEETEDPEERLQKFKDYWKSKDPSPNTTQNEVLYEYYRRVAYANKNFKHYYAGWRTDMGMIYIMLGPPNNVERHPFEYDSKPYEIWYYYGINQQFYFVDDTGFGDYRLLNFNYGDWYRYRQ